MKNPFSEPRWAAQIISLLVLLGLVALYFFWYVPAQGDYFAKRNFRVLALTSEQIKKTIEAIPSALRYAAQSVEKDGGLSQPASETELVAQVKKAIELIPALTLVDEPKVQNGANAPASLSINIRPGSSWVEFDYRSSAGNNTNRLVTIHAKCDLTQLAGSPREFDGLLVALESGEVVFQKLPAGLNVQKLNRPREEQSGASSSNLVQRASSLVPVVLAGNQYKFFIQPLQIVAPLQTVMSNNWLVCGVVLASRFNSESLEVDYIFLILFIFLVLFAALSVVFPKVGFAGPREPLRRRTVILLASGTLGGAALLTVLLLDVTVYPIMEDYFDDPSESLANEIRSNFNDEVAELHKILLGLDKLKNGPLYSETNILTEMLQAPGVTNIIGDSPAHFELVFWIGKDGMQTAKWTVRRIVTPLIPVRERSYFQDALKDQNTVQSRRDKGTNLFWLEPIYSLTTGENSVVLSLRSASGGEPAVAAIESRLQSLIRPVLPPGYGFCVITVNGRVLFHSEVGRNLRENLFEECEGNARLRSAVLGRTSEQFDIPYLGRTHHFYVTPMDNLQWTLVVFRDERLLSAANFEVVLATLFLLVIWLLAPAAVVFLILGLPWLIRLALGQPSTLAVLPGWLWPDWRRWRAYLSWSGLNLLLAVILVIIIALFPSSPWWVVSCAVAGAIAGILAGGHKLTRPSSDADLQIQRMSGFFGWCYVAALISLLLLVAVVPAFACYKIALDQRVKLFVKQGQFTFAQSLRERVERIKTYDREAPGRDDLEAKLWLDADHLPWGVYAGTNVNLIAEDDWPTATRTNDRRTPTHFDWLFTAIMPLHDYATVGSRSLLSDRAKDDSWYWSNEGKMGLVFHDNNYRDQGSLRLSTPKIKIPIISMGLLMLVVMSAALLFPVCFLAHRIFLVNTLAQNISVAGALSTDRLQEHLLVFESAAHDRPLLDRLGSEVAQRRRNDCLEIDCRLESFDAPAQFGGQRNVILDHFEHGWDDPMLNRRKWQLLDKLVSQPGRFVVVSLARNFSQTGTGDTSLSTASGAAAGNLKMDSPQWSELWREFRWVFLKAPAGEEQPGYRAIWASCSKDEQLALFHVATHGFLHSRNPELPTLISKGLLINDRGLNLMDEGFARFARNAVDPQEARSYNQQVTSRGWEVIKGPVYLALVAVALLMFVTQPEIYKVVFGILTAFAAGPPAILKLLSFFESDKDKKPAAG